MSGDQDIDPIDLRDHAISFVFARIGLQSFSALRIFLETAMIDAHDVIGMFLFFDEPDDPLCRLTGIRESKTFDILRFFPVGNMLGRDRKERQTFPCQFFYDIIRSQWFSLVEDIGSQTACSAGFQMIEQSLPSVVEIMVSHIDKIKTDLSHGLGDRIDLIPVFLIVIESERRTLQDIPVIDQDSILIS